MQVQQHNNLQLRLIQILKQMKNKINSNNNNHHIYKILCKSRLIRIKNTN